MEENKKITETNWGLIEEMAQKLCPDEFELASRSDLDFIEQQVAEGKVISLEDDGGDMHSYELYVMTLQTVIAALHLVLDYFFSSPYRKNRKKNQEKVKDFVGIITGRDEESKDMRQEVKDFLTSQRDEINQWLQMLEMMEGQNQEGDKPE